MIEHSEFHFPRGIWNKCILLKWTLDFSLFFLVDVVVLRLSLTRLNVTQRLGILKECNMLCMLIVECMLLLLLLCV